MLRIVLAPLIGAGVGYAYYKLVGCVSGTCPITSNPWASMIYGAIMGYMVASIGAGK